jgi:acetoin utilization deacetylase AcuC-like enzyme
MKRTTSLAPRAAVAVKAYQAHTGLASCGFYREVCSIMMPSMADQPDANPASSRTGLVFDERFKRHDTGPGHPERPARLDAVRDALMREGLIERCQPLPLREANDTEILALHDPAYVERLRTYCEAGRKTIDAIDSAICPESYALARLAAGSILNAVDAVVSGEVDNAFCAVRPPGHHCERGESMGFCLLANVAIAAQYLRDRHGIDRVAVIDWDVHHGNGTQHLFETRDDILFVSLHGHPAYVYPGSGFAEERGKGAGDGATLNVPFYPGAVDDDYRKAFDAQVLPMLDDYKPRFVLVSAGFDAHARDPLAPIDLETQSFGWMSRAVLDIARQHAGGKLVSVLEGGYDLQALGESVALHVHTLLGDPAG